MRRFFGHAWHPDAEATFRDVCADARLRRSRLGYLWTVLAEIIDLISASVRARLGRSLPITGGHRPPPPHTSGFTIQQLLDDLAGGWRRLARQPRAAAGAIALLTLAIGVTSAMFTIVDAFIVRPAPYRDAAALSNLWIQGRGTRTDFALVRAWRDSGAFDAVLPVVINAGGEFKSATGVVTRSGARITPGTFANLGVTPLLGREFVQGEGTDGNDDYVLLS
jgi:hypothetical protein